jgi:acid phosphatase (class A)
MLARFMRTLLRTLLAFLALAAASRAAEMDSAVPLGGYYYIAPSSVDVEKVLPAPPAAGSLAALADLEAVVHEQKVRSAQDVAFAKAVAEDNVFFFGEFLGPWFNPKGLPETALLLKHVNEDAARVSAVTKKLYSRPRPYAIEPLVSPCVEEPKSFSYPSGHSMRAFVWAAVLSELFPDQKVALFQRAHDFAWARVVGGVHFPTDTVGGRILAGAIVERLMRSPEFQAALARAKAELAPYQAKKAA